MMILLRDTDLDGQPIIGSGLLIPGDTTLEVVQKMQATSPFNDGDLAGYMRRVLDAAGDEKPLPNDGEPAARAFLERLARHGLVEFVKEKKEDASGQERPPRLEQALTEVRDSGLVNMFDYPQVATLSRRLGYPEVGEWIETNKEEYVAFLFSGGTRPLGDTSTKKGDDPCADKRD